ncbi:uncharacterized protein [Primulina huaijiensis]|uniref:uncharacterized protein n=1 Tax=Primulina huaijiensis TaxID=1492673 RepID=UPI003CC73911
MIQNKDVEISYFKAWRGRQLALDKLLGSPEESYLIMPSYFYIIEQVNRGSKTDLVTDSTVQDGDFHQFPIAWAIVDSENDDSWTWFLQKLKEFINDDPNLNLKRVSGGKGGIDLFMKTTYAYKVYEFDELYGCLKERAYSPGARYNIMTTNGVESINAKLKSEREMPIVALLDAIHKLTSKWFNKHRNAPAIYGAKLDLYDFFSPYYSSQMWALAYADTIYPVPIANEWNIPDHIKYNVLLPDVKRKRGTAQKERIPSIGEFGRKRTKKCGVCHESGHCRKKFPKR